jgi:hypothetical protein
MVSRCLSRNDKMRIGTTWLKRIEERMKGDSWGEHLTAFVPEFYGPMLCFEGLEADFHAQCPAPKSLNEARAKLLSIASAHVPAGDFLSASPLNGNSRT